MCSGDQAARKAQALKEMEARLAANKAWSRSIEEKSPGYFNKLVGLQAPEVLWIGCADARVPANELIGLRPGEVLVQRNVGNIASFKDMNLMSCLEYAVAVLRVKHIIVCGHYGCGAVEGVLQDPIPGRTSALANLWIQDVRDTLEKNVEALRELEGQARRDKLAELNVMRQVFNVCTSPVVQQAWDAGRQLQVHGLVYALNDGILKTIYTTEARDQQPGSFTRSSSSTRSIFASSFATSSGAAPPAAQAGFPDEAVRMSFEV